MMQVGPGAQSDAPKWLVEFVMTPPWWFLVGLVALAGLMLALAARHVYSRDLYISREEQREMLLIVGTVETIAVGVVLAMNVLSLGYLGDVAVGVVSGFVAVEVLRRADVLLAGRLADERAQIALAWVVVGVGAIVLPKAAAVNGVPSPGGLDMAIGGVAFCMLFWTIMQEYGPGETVGEVMRAGE